MTAASGLLAAGLLWLWFGSDDRVRILRLLGRPQQPWDRQLLAVLGRRKLRRRGQPRTTQLLQAIINEVKAGALPADAVANALGVPAIDPEGLIAHPPTADAHIWRDVANVWRTSSVAGFSMAVALQRIHAYALSEQEAMAEVVAIAAGPRLTTWVMAALPVVVWVAGGAMGGDPLAWLSHGFGLLAACIGAVLLVSGFLWVRWLIAKAMR